MLYKYDREVFLMFIGNLRWQTSFDKVEKILV